MVWIFAALAAVLFGIVLLQRELLKNAGRQFEAQFIKNCRLEALVIWLEHELEDKR